MAGNEVNNQGILTKPAFIYSIFTLFFLLSIFPVIGFQYFPTVDGPAHLYNARIIRELFAGNDFYSRFFHFNGDFVPNWTGHLILATAGIFFPVWVAEKILLMLFILGTPLAILFVLRNMGAPVQWSILLLMPFANTITLYLGFFNFLLSITIFFCAISVILRLYSNDSLRKVAFITILFTVLYFTHIFSFALALIYMFVFSLFTILSIRKFCVKTHLLNWICTIPACIFAFIFYSGRGVNGFKNKVEQLAVTDLLEWLATGAPLIGLNGNVEKSFTTVFAWTIILLAVVILMVRLATTRCFFVKDILLVMSIIMLVLFFIIPDGYGSGGFISLRLLLMFMLFLTSWIVSHQLPLRISVISGLIAIAVSFGTIQYRVESARYLDDEAREVMLLGASIKKNSIVLPLNYSQNWLHTNLSNYIGAGNNVIVLDNYEALLNEFPVKWNDDIPPGTKAGNFAQTLNPVITIETYEQAANRKIDYLSRWNFNNSSTDSISVSTGMEILRNYDLLKISGRAELFIRNVNK